MRSFGKGCMGAIGAVVGLIIIIVVIVAIAGGGSSKHSSGTTKSPALVHGGSPGSGKSTSKAKTQVFKGTGSQNIGTINVSVDSTLHWSCPSCGDDNFIIDNSPTDDALINVNGLNQKRGKTVVDAGLYHDVSINTEGSAWTIKMVPGT